VGVRFGEALQAYPGRAHVAQSAEHFLGKEEVMGSNPIVSSRSGGRRTIPHGSGESELPSSIG
jgi:hypothetical protein